MTTKTTTPLIIKVKKEPATDEIKDFAETAMNELLGWYGYDSVDRNDLARCASRISTINNSNTINNNPNHNDSATAATTPHPSSSHGNAPAACTRSNANTRATTFLATSTTSPTTTTTTAATTQSPTPTTTPATTMLHGGNSLQTTTNATTHNAVSLPQPPASLGGNHHATLTPDRYTNNSSPESSRSRQSHSPLPAVGGHQASSVAAAGGNEDKSDVECGWCRRSVALGSPEFLATPEGPRYCTESCFSQSRRASFKRAKTCDWCKHVRHAVSYVDFQDGASQLQFCSDKCLNQYKMQIFCRETQAHLDQHPHLKDTGKAGTEGALITPDLWLRNCKSRSVSPASDASRPDSPARISSQPPLPPHRPVITLAPSSKLLSRSHIDSPSSSAASTAAASATTSGLTPPMTRVSPRVTRKRRSLRIVHSVGSRYHRSSPTPHPPSPSPGTKPVATVQLNGNPTNTCGMASTATPTLQDLTTNAQLRNISISARLLSPKPAGSNQQPPSIAVQNYHQFLSPPSNLYPMRTSPSSSSSAAAHSPHFPRAHIAPSYSGPPMHQQPSSFGATTQQHYHAAISHPQPSTSSIPVNAPPPQLQPHVAAASNEATPINAGLFGASSTPPITILVPYPILVPVPIPIPIPMPIVAFLRAAQLKMDAENNNHSTHNHQHHRPAPPPPPATSMATTAVGESEKYPSSSRVVEEQPLDCSKMRELCAEDDPEQLIEVVCDDEDDTNDDDDDHHHIGTPASSDGDEDMACSPNEPAPATNQPIPKFKITRLNSRRGFITSSEPVPGAHRSPAHRQQSSPTSERRNCNSSEAGAGILCSPPTPHEPVVDGAATATWSTVASETSRPLRKRKRVVDCDYSRFRDDERKRNPATNSGSSGGGGASK